jgi:hypothetical protein
MQQGKKITYYPESGNEKNWNVPISPQCENICEKLQSWCNTHLSIVQHATKSVVAVSRLALAGLNVNSM